MHQQLKCQLENKFRQQYLQMFCTTGILFKCRNNVWQQMSIHSPESYICFSCKGFSLPTQWVPPTPIQRVKLLILSSRMTKNGRMFWLDPTTPKLTNCINTNFCCFMITWKRVVLAFNFGDADSYIGCITFVSALPSSHSFCHPVFRSHLIPPISIDCCKSSIS